ncbi:hypothetical protein GCM10009836_28980 [Pseudonocardia ailaonensis]|uniref:DUF1453 domain-containing protein n=1 Tax=Pseudonocardia ailaonensis TaxID=367279 RepID=A0ABN2N545_9PSEU
MSPLEIVILVAMVGYAIYRQTQRHEVVGGSRYKMAIIYAVVGLAVGGFSRPDTAAEWGLLAAGLVLSIVVGLARGRLTRIWAEDTDEGHRVYSQGTALTVGLFLALVLAKFGLGTYAYFAHISDDGGFGEVLIMIAVMVAFQAELIWHRARALGARTSSKELTTAGR